MIEKEKFSVKNKKLDDPELFPQTFIYEPRRWKITIDRHYQQKYFELVLNGIPYSQLPYMPRNSVIDGDDIGNQVMCGIIIINDLQILGQKKHNYTGTMSWSVEKVSEMLFGENKEVMDRALSEEVKQG